MKRISVLLVLLCLSAFTAAAGDKTRTALIRTRIACDHCKRCESCSGRLENALYDRKGVKRVEIDDKKMTIKVVYNTEKIKLDDIRSVIAASGFDADEVKALPEAFEKLDGCCKGTE